mmetsp:Transcript_18635/g.44356  ORF Transcript_18635/g.44356 Transcript_18635/m.44356 type:complete len:280 (-) Transcript_18635:19-858(-)
MSRSDGALDSITFSEKSLAQRVKAFGTADAETIRKWKQLNTEYNVSAMKFLQGEDYETALDLLNRAKQLITADVKFGEQDDRRKLLAITYNNMSCIYKRRGLLKTALTLAHKALKLETESTKADNPACTHLNLCAILSRLDRHQHALQHCQCALELLERGEGAGGMTPGLMNDYQDEPESSILAVCYHNMAVEHEHLKHSDDALQCYFRSVEVAQAELGPDHVVTLAFERRAREAEANIEAKGRVTARGMKGSKMSEYDKKLVNATPSLKTAAGAKTRR